GSLMASINEVSHCYERATTSCWNYNLFTMIHARSKRVCEEIVMDISKKIKIKDYKILYTTKEFKKMPMRYW
ncbi:MAG: Lrp/AsnC family transcriptional regulator, partial [bacterium]|nr:Lrp/AsnC family transcriptional regulator [bacterium]